MPLSSDIISQFVKITKDDKKTKTETTVYGTTVEHNGKQYVKLDGSELLTPIVTTTNTKANERVTVMIKNHTATVTGNISSPSARTNDVTDLAKDTNDAITEVEILVANKVDTEELAAETARIDNLNAENALIKETLIASGVDTEELKAANATITETLKVNQADINNLKATKLDANIADVKYASTENLEAINANVHNLSVSYGKFAELTSRDLTAINGSINNLNTQKANIDFSNIGQAAIEQLFTKSGMIKDLVVGEGTITGQLVGVTISGDLIEGNTIKAEKLVVKGTDGLYYKLNTDGMKVETQQTDQNSLNGSVIKAKSITATKISVSDLVAFDATIGGFKITDDSIYSGVKESVGNTTRGIYLDNDGQIALGDSTNYLKYYKDTDGSYKLEIAAKSVTFGVNNESVETVLTNLETATNKSIVSTTEQFYQSTSATSLSGGTWSNTQPTWYDGKYIWRRTLVKYGDGSTAYTPSSTGVCITGNTGATGATGPQGPQGVKGDTGEQGPQGVKGDTGEQGPKGDTGSTGATGPKGDTGKGVKSIDNYYLASTSSSGVTTSTSGWTSTVQNVTSSKKYLWNYEVITYTDNSTYSTVPCIIGAYGNTGATGPQGEQGPQGEKGDTGETGSTGATGNGILSITEKYAVSASNTTAPTSWNATPPTMTATNKYLWNYETITYTNGTSTDTKKRVIGVYGDRGATGSTGATGPQGPQGATGEQGPKGDTGATGRGIKSITNYYLASSSSSGVTTSTSGWTTAIQNVSSSKKYLWNYEVVTYTDNSTYSTTPCMIGAYGETGLTGPQGPKGDTGATGSTGPQGPKGDTGETGSTGATGNGISSITEKYAISTSNTSAPTSWSDTPPSMTATNKYLWNYEIITYTNGATVSTKKRVIGVYGDKGNTGSTGATGATGPQGPKGDTGATGPQGPKGDTGATGKGVKSITNYYLASASSSGVTSSTSGWTTTVQNVTSSKKYLWNYEVVTYTDNTTYSTTPCVIGAYGDTGATGPQGPQGDKGNTGSTGATGNGISSITEKYAVSTSNTSAPTSWSNTPPTMTSTNKYLWNYEIVAYTNGTTVNTQKRVIGVYGDKGATGSTGAQGPKGDTGAAGKDANAVAHTFSGTSATTGYVAFATVEITQAYCNAPCSFRLADRGQEMSDVQFQFANSNTLDPGLSYIRADGGIKLWMVKIETSKWQIIAQKSEAYDNFTLFNFNKPSGSNGYTVTWTNTHLTSLPSGSIAAGLLSSAKTATNYMNLDNSGLVVGNLTASTLGKNVLIASDSVNIRTGTTVNASFSEKRIELGKNASDAVIELCGDKGEIEYDDTTGYLQITGDNLRLKGSNQSALYSDYYNGAELGKKAYVTTSIDQVSISASKSQNLNSSGVGTWTTSEIRVSPQEVYTLTDNILEMSRYGSTYETLTGDITLNPSGSLHIKKNVYISKDDKTAHNDGVAGWYLGTDGTAHATGNGGNAAICFHYDGKIENTSVIKEKTAGEITINGFNFAKNKVLWSGEMYMSANQSAALSEAISAQTNGIVLVFSRYSSGVAQNYHFNTHFIPKSQVSKHAGAGHIILLSSDGSFGLFASKYLYINNTSIVGNDINTTAGTGACNIKYDNKAYVLRYVIGV